MDKAENDGNVLDTRIAVAVRGAGDCAPDGKFQTGPVKFFYAWSRRQTSGTDMGTIGEDEKMEGVKSAIENLFKVPEFRSALSPSGLLQANLSKK